MFRSQRRSRVSRAGRDSFCSPPARLACCHPGGGEPDPADPNRVVGCSVADFPRLPFAAALTAVGFCLALFLRIAPRTIGSALALVAVAFVVNATILWPYLPTGATRPDACPTERRLSVLVANVQLGNQIAEPLVDIIERVEPDLLLAMERTPGGTKP